MDKVSIYPPWWAYCMVLGGIVISIYWLRDWRETKNQKGYAFVVNFLNPLMTLIGMIVCLIILIRQDCTGYLAK
jgi:phosphatidylglycerophosphate synthase